ncbi:MAG TPA: ABC transporter substrate-binding protein [Gemmatimonadaceae bacterium]|nr:ABC transporter substrate-binding protein [Gemmatimonadaceae bacterium]
MIMRSHVGTKASGLFLGLAILFAAACSGSSAASDRVIVDSRDESDPRSIDPSLSTDVPTGRAVAYLFDGLTSFDAAANVKPALAERWDISPDGRVYTFHLRQGVKFHDGTPFTARQVLSSWLRVLDPKAKSGRGEPLYPIKGARDYAQGTATRLDGVVIRDDSTVVVTLNEPMAVFPKLLAMPVGAIVPENAGADLSDKPIGTGPWKLVEWKHDDYLLFARNDAYWGGPPKAESLRARIIAEPSTAVAEFESGNVSILRVPPSEARDWTENDARKPLLKSVAALQLVYVAMNVTRGPLTDVRVRQAINHAVDIPRIIERLVGGRGTPAAGVIPPSLAGYDPARAPYKFDPARAKALLAEAGHPNGIDVELWCSTNPTYVRIAETMQAYLGVVGIRVKIVQREAAATRAAARKGETDMILKDWYADYPDAENFLFPLLHSANKGVGGNVSFFANAEFDRTVDAARRELDEAKRNELYRAADAVAQREAPMLFFYFYNDLYAVQPWIKGFEPPVIFNGQRWLDVSIVKTP